MSRTPWIAAIEAATQIGKSRRTVYRLIRDRAFTVRRVSGTWEIDQRSVTAYLGARTITATPTGDPA